MLRYTLRRFALVGGGGGGGGNTCGFSSAAFTGDDDGAYERLKREQEMLKRQHASKTPADDSAKVGSASSGSDSSSNHDDRSFSSKQDESSSPSFTGSSPGKEEWQSSDDTASAYTTASTSAPDALLKRPTVDTYQAMSDDELVRTLHLRDQQIAQLRHIYENFHYEADKHFRKMIFDYHDKTMQLSQVHGRMQQASLQINREALMRMREEQERMTRDKRIIMTLCTIWSLVFWVWVRRHYVERRQLAEEPAGLPDRAQLSPSVTGIGSYGDNYLFGSNKRNARFAETAWEREVRERREAQAAQVALLSHQAEVQRVVAARDAAGEKNG